MRASTLLRPAAPGPWRKLGLVFAPDPAVWWQQSHASLPVVVPVAADDPSSRRRVLFASRDAEGRSHVGALELDLDDPTRVLAVDAEPVLVPGPPGTFDADGVYASSAVRLEDGTIRLYTIGWQRGVPAPLFRSAIGLAVSRDGGRTFEKVGRAPLLDRSEHDPCLVTSPVVVPDGPGWRMFYVSGTSWEWRDGRLSSCYHVKTATSPDGLAWLRDGTVAFGAADALERNIGRTHVTRTEDGGWLALGCSDRGSGYRAFVATSRNGLDWERFGTPAGLEPGPEPWDDAAVAYPYLVRHGDRWLCFYNGNANGRDGFGVAVAPA